MDHAKFDLGQLKAGAVVVVTLKNQANVLLMDATNYRAYAAGKRGAQYYGGLAKTSPRRMPVPRTGHWYVAIDLGGNAGRISADVRVEN